MVVELYEVRIKGQLGTHWEESFEGWSILHEEDGTTLLTGPVDDQPALYGLLTQMSNLNIKLIAVNRIEVDSNSHK